MEKQEKDHMILSIEESLDLCDWLLERGIGLGECACVLCELNCGETFALSLMRVFIRRKELQEKINDKAKTNDWSDPITP